VGTLTEFIQGKLVFFDSAPLIYYIEQHPVFGPPAEELFEALDVGWARGATSVLTLAEVLTKPLREGRQDLASQYRRSLTDTVGLMVCPIGAEVCERAARLRARYVWLRTPDALQVATAITFRADALVTNDEQWKHLTNCRSSCLKIT
jgi:predicted nucleic acid-binding protein